MIVERATQREIHIPSTGLEEWLNKVLKDEA